MAAQFFRDYFSVFLVPPLLILTVEKKRAAS